MGDVAFVALAFVVEFVKFPMPTTTNKPPIRNNEAKMFTCFIPVLSILTI
jgi:hypothetical protein